MSSRIDIAWEKLCDKWELAGYHNLSAAEKVWLNLRSLIDSVENGGLISYFYNSGADTYPDMLTALSEVGEIDIQAQVLRVAALFPNGISSDIEKRNDVIDSWPDDDRAVNDLLEEVDHRLMPMMAALEEALEKFIDVHGLAT